MIDGAYTNYERVLPKARTKTSEGSSEELRQDFTRTAMLSNEKYRVVRLQLSDDQLRITANNPEQEEAEEEINVNYKGDELEIGFNVNYLLDVLNVLRGETVSMQLSDPNSSAL